MTSSIHALHSNAVQQRSVVIVIPDADLRQRLGERLSSLRWRVLSASGGAEAMVHLDEAAPEAMIVDHCSRVHRTRRSHVPGHRPAAD